MVKFKNLCQKDTPPTAHLLAIVAPISSQVPPQTVDLIVALAEAIVRVDPNSSEATLLNKRKGKELTAGLSKRSKKKARGDELGHPPFLGCWR